MRLTARITSDTDVLSSIRSSWSFADYPFLYTCLTFLTESDLNSHSVRKFLPSSFLLLVQNLLEIVSREKWRDLTQSYDKSPYIDRKNPESNVTTQKRHQKNFDYTTIADRLRTVSCGNDCHQTGVVKPVYGIPTFL